MTSVEPLLTPIRKRAKAYAEHGTPGLAAPRDRAALLAAVEAVLALADKAYNETCFVLPGGYPSRPVEANRIRAAIMVALGKEAL